MEIVLSEYPFINFSLLLPLVLLALRIMLATTFIHSGWRHFTDPEGSGNIQGLSILATRTTGITDIVSGVLIALGILTHIGALMMIGVMLGAIYFKAFVWKTGLFNDQHTGWYVDALLLVTAALVLALGPGYFSLDQLIF